MRLKPFLGSLAHFFRDALDGDAAFVQHDFRRFLVRKILQVRIMLAHESDDLVHIAFNDETVALCDIILDGFDIRHLLFHGDQNPMAISRLEDEFKTEPFAMKPSAAPLAANFDLSLSISALISFSDRMCRLCSLHEVVPVLRGNRCPEWATCTKPKLGLASTSFGIGTGAVIVRYILG